MNTTTKGLVAGTAGVALLLGAGGTFALWQDDTTVSGGTIQAGSMHLDSDEAMSWFDVSPDRSDALPLDGIAVDWSTIDFGDESSWSGTSTDFAALNEVGPIVGHAIDPLSWRIVPGDTVLGTAELDAEIVGDNFVGNLIVKSAADDSELAQAMGLRYIVVNHQGLQLGKATPVGEALEIGGSVAGNHHLRVLVVGQLPVEVGSAPGHQGNELQGALADVFTLEITLSQVRAAA